MPIPFGIGILFQVPWDQANARDPARLEPLDAGRPVEVRLGTPPDDPFAVNSGPIPLAHGGRYEVGLSVEGGFRTLVQPGPGSETARSAESLLRRTPGGARGFERWAVEDSNLRPWD
jgi:hypothetical protein